VNKDYKIASRRAREKAGAVKDSGLDDLSGLNYLHCAELAD
jgi:hypothetical protein